jgi:hypothetical protein
MVSAGNAQQGSMVSDATIDHAERYNVANSAYENDGGIATRE